MFNARAFVVATIFTLTAINSFAADVTTEYSLAPTYESIIDCSSSAPRDCFNFEATFTDVPDTTTFSIFVTPEYNFQAKLEIEGAVYGTGWPVVEFGGGYNVKVDFIDEHGTKFNSTGFGAYPLDPAGHAYKDILSPAGKTFEMLFTLTYFPGLIVDNGNIARSPGNAYIRMSAYAVPEPSSLSLVLAATCVLGVWLKINRQRAHK